MDHTAGDLPVFESGAIMWYLATKDPEHKLWPKVRAALISPQRCCRAGSAWVLLLLDGADHALRVQTLEKQSDVMSWLMFQMGGLGPMQGQANHFVR